MYSIAWPPYFQKENELNRKLKMSIAHTVYVGSCNGIKLHTSVSYTIFFNILLKSF